MTREYKIKLLTDIQAGRLSMTFFKKKRLVSFHGYLGKIGEIDNKPCSEKELEDELAKLKEANNNFLKPKFEYGPEEPI